MNDTSTALAGTGTNGSGRVARAVDNASTTAHATIDSLSNAAKPAVDRFASSAHRAVDKVAVAATGAADSLEVQAGKLKEGHARMTEQCRAQVRENPLTALGIAAAVGFLLSRLIASR